MNERMKYWITKFWLRVGIRWFTFARWCCRQIAFGFTERDMPIEAERWKIRASKYHFLLGVMLATQLRLVIERAIQSSDPVSKSFVESAEPSREPVNSDIVVRGQGGIMEVWSADCTTLKGFMRNGMFERNQSEAERV